jgi:hypothetical protein
MSSAGSIKVGVLGALATIAMLAGCGGGGSLSQTVGQLPTVTAPQLTTQPKAQTRTGGATATQAQTTASTPAGTSGAASSGGSSARQGGSKPAKQSKADRQRQADCEQQVAGLTGNKQRQALQQCLNPTPLPPEVPETQVQR